MTRREALERLAWRNTHKDFRGKIDGKKTVLKCVEGKGTCLAFLSSLSEDELIGRISKADREQCKGVIYGTEGS